MIYTVKTAKTIPAILAMMTPTNMLEILQLVVTKTLRVQPKTMPTLYYRRNIVTMILTTRTPCTDGRTSRPNFFLEAPPKDAVLTVVTLLSVRPLLYTSAKTSNVVLPCFDEVS